MIVQLVRIATWPARKIGGLVLDTILGPEENTDYVSKTGPASSPPAHN